MKYSLKQKYKNITRDNIILLDLQYNYVIKNTVVISKKV